MGVYQFQDLLNNYGKDDDESVSFIKFFYENKDIHDLFKKNCEELYDIIMKKISTASEEAKGVHEHMTWYVNFAMKFMKVGVFRLLEYNKTV